MAWTTPRTWVTDELVTAAMMNAHVRDNFNSLMHLIVRKTADESVISTTTLQDDDHLLMAVAANEVWRFEFVVLVTGLFDFLAQLTFPSGTIAGSAWGIDTGTTAGEIYNISSASSPSGQLSLRADSTSVPYVHLIQGIIANAGTAGNLQLQWAQVVSGGTATIVRTNSTLWAARLA